MDLGTMNMMASTIGGIAMVAAALIIRQSRIGQSPPASAGISTVDHPYVTIFCVFGWILVGVLLLSGLLCFLIFILGYNAKDIDGVSVHIFWFLISLCCAMGPTPFKKLVRLMPLATIKQGRGHSRFWHAALLEL
jgi:hypothetical protein